MKAKPFLKWAGGKNQLISQLNLLYPKELHEGKIEKYFEPFIGGGAVFFDIMQNFKVKSAFISDTNKDLILAYKVIQQKSGQLCSLLETYQKKYDKTEPEKKEALYYQIREEFNNQNVAIEMDKFSDSAIKRTAQLIFMNKTGFNGLFRLNSKGGFNVPFGKYKNPNIFDNENIKAVSAILNKVEISFSNYHESFDNITQNSFIYFDPPYRPISKTASFTSYSASGFSDKQQLELAQYFRKIDHEKKAKIMLSNSDPKNENPDDNFFDLAFRIDQTGFSYFILCTSRIAYKTFN